MEIWNSRTSLANDIFRLKTGWVLSSVDRDDVLEAVKVLKHQPKEVIAYTQSDVIFLAKDMGLAFHDKHIPGCD